MRTVRGVLTMVLLGGLAFADEPPAAEDPDLAAVPHEERKADGDEAKRYFLLGPRGEAKAPAKGHPLLVVLPGGDGSAEFLAFVKRIHKNALGEEWLAAELVARKWKDEQEITWPTATSRVPDMKFTTEEFIEAVVADVAKDRKVDKTRVYALGWSSSGPPLYAHSLTSKKSTAKKSVVGYYVAMSVFRPARLPALGAAKGEAYFLDHSPGDKVCPFDDAKRADEALRKEGAKVKLVTYEGGHGWHGDVYGRLKEGVAWLEENRAKPGR